LGDAAARHLELWRSAWNSKPRQPMASPRLATRVVASGSRAGQQRYGLGIGTGATAQLRGQIGDRPARHAPGSASDDSCLIHLVTTITRVLPVPWACLATSSSQLLCSSDRQWRRASW